MKHCARSPFLVRMTRGGATFDGVQRTLEQHAELARALSLMASGHAEITISENGRIPSISLPIGEFLSGPLVDQLPAISKFLDGWEMLLSKAGVGSGDRFNFDEIWTADEARIAVEMLLSPKPAMRMEFQSLANGDQAHPVEAILFRTCALGSASLTYSVKVTFEQSNDPVWRYRSATFKALDVRPKGEDLEEYGFDQGEAQGITLLLDPRNLKLDPGASAS